MGIDPKLAYWTGALLNMLVMVSLALLGVRRARRGDFWGHRRRMLAAAWLVVAFMVSYVVKVALLGSEQLELWRADYVRVLRFHELCVLIMVAAGLTAIVWAKRLGLPLSSSSPDPDPERLEAGIRLHRWAGRAALVTSILGVLGAAYLLWGMYERF